MKRALMVFVDGVGIGDDDPAINPLVAAATPALDAILGRKLAGFSAPFSHNGALVIPTDATLGVPGLPQSATGQTALLTGVNAAAVEGRHVTAYPTKALREILSTQSIFARVRDAGGTAALANTYTPQYFQAIADGRMRHAAFTFSALAAGVRLRGLEDLRAGEAIFHDLTNARLRAWGYDVPERTPRESGRILGRLSGGYHFTAFEFFLSDLAAHQRVPLPPAHVVDMVDGLLGGVLEEADLEETLVLLISDHGNLEDSRARAHTRNPVPAVLIGAGRDEVGGRVKTLSDVTPALLRWLAPSLPLAPDPPHPPSLPLSPDPPHPLPLPPDGGEGMESD